MGTQQPSATFAVPSGSYQARLLFSRAGMLATTLIVELIAISIWLDTAALHGSTRLIATIADAGPGILRCVVAFAVVALTFSESALSDQLHPAAARLAGHRVQWHLLAAHFAMVLVFAWLSSVLFRNIASGILENAVAIAWLLSGAIAIAGAAVALLPAAFWKHLFLCTRPILVFAAGVAIGAYVLGILALKFWQPLSWATMAVAYTMVHPFLDGLTIDFSTFVIGVPGFEVAVTAPCSGYEGLGLILVFTSGWLWLNRSLWRFPHALLIVPIGIVAIWITNCLRIAALVLIGSAGATNVAFGGFHSQAGWLGFNAVAIAVCLTSRRTAWLLRRSAEDVIPSRVSNPTAAFLLPFLTILAAAMVAQLASAGFEWFYSIRVIAAAAALLYFAHAYRALDWRVTWVGVVLGVVAFGLWMTLERLLFGASTASIPSALAESPQAQKSAWVAFRLVGAVVTVPIAEELAFRAFLLRRLMSADFESVSWQSVSWLAVLLSSLAFGILHGERWLAGTVVGVTYAIALLRRGSIGDAAVAHATTNALIAGFVLFGGHWRLW